MLNNPTNPTCTPHCDGHHHYLGLRDPSGASRVIVLRSAGPQGPAGTFTDETLISQPEADEDFLTAN